MIERKVSLVQAEIERVECIYVVCNVCGNRSQSFPDSKECWEAQETEAFSVFGGYGNRHHGDCTAIRWHACQDCLGAWVKSFKIQPESAEFEPFRFGDEEKLDRWMRFKDVSLEDRAVSAEEQEEKTE